MDAQTKVSRAIVKLVSDAPFYGSIALRINVREDENVSTMCTDGKSILWGREFVEKITEAECRGVLAHECLHIVLLHHLRTGNRDRAKCNIAMDFAINLILKQEGFELPEGVLYDEQYLNMNWEKIYELLPDNMVECPWGGVMELTDENGNPLTGDALEQAKADIEQMAVAAAEAAKKAGKELHGAVAKIIKTIRACLLYTSPSPRDS